jgi:predicted dienelactone hydrolase
MSTKTGKMAAAYDGSHGPFHVQAAIFDWVDASRNREVPAKIYFPKDTAGKFPLVIFSHGLGGTRQGYEYVGRHWTSHGYICVHVQHRGSDNKIGKNTGKLSDEMLRAAGSFENLFNRPKDVTFAIDQMMRLNGEAGSEFRGLVDMGRIGVAGHSFGGYTAHAVSGRLIWGPEGILDLCDNRIKACIAISAPARDTDEFRQSFSSFRKPCLHITGVHDTSPIGETKVEHRRLPFDSIRSHDQYLVIFRDADHMVFTGKVWPGRVSTVDGEIHRLVKASTSAFWDAYLKGEEDAKVLLKEGGMESILGAHASVEKK